MWPLYFQVIIDITDQSVLKPFLLGQGKFLVLLKHMSLGSLQGAAALAAGVSQVSILQAGDSARVSTPARQNFSTYITTMDWHQDSVQSAVLDLSE